MTLMSYFSKKYLPVHESQMSDLLSFITFSLLKAPKIVPVLQPNPVYELISIIPFAGTIADTRISAWH